MPLLNEILGWVIPPVFGAVIGYLTNDIAIKMLFRPLVEKRIFKMRVPFTPGIIPKQREQLAESIGAMVHHNLITVDAVSTHLQTESIRSGIKQYIGDQTGIIIHKPVSELDKEKLTIFFESLEKFLNQTLDQLFSSEHFRVLLRKGISGINSSLGKTKIIALLEKSNLKEILIAYIYPFLTGDKMQSLLSRGINQWLTNKLNKDTPLSQIIPENFIDLLTNIFRSFLPDLLTALFQWLRSPEIKYQLETQGRGLLKDILDKLNVMQKFFLSVAQYDKSLDKKMPAIVEDALKAFEEGAFDPVNQATFTEAVKDGIIRWEGHSIRNLLSSETDSLPAKIDLLLEKIFHAISTENVRTYIANGVDDFIAANRDKTLKEVVEGDLKADLSALEEFAYSHIVAYLSGEQAVKEISTAVVKFLVNLVAGMEQNSLAKLFNLNEEHKSRIDDFLFDQIYGIAEKKLPDILTQLNIKALVVNKINNLKIEEVEKLLLMVIEKHLKWINIFGALLGGLIGFSQVLLRFLL